MKCLNQNFRKGMAVGLVVLGSLLSTVSEANITYSFNRAIGAGSASGFFETDGTLGLLNFSNLVNWSVTIQAPNINGGVATTGTTGSTVSLGGVSATATDLLFDFAGNDLFYVWNNAFTDWWCVAGSNSGCFIPNAESIGYSDTNIQEAQSVAFRGVQSIASVDSQVPEPSVLALIGVGLLGMSMTRRRRV